VVVEDPVLDYRPPELGAKGGKESAYLVNRRCGFEEDGESLQYFEPGGRSGFVHATFFMSSATWGCVQPGQAGGGLGSAPAGRQRGARFERSGVRRVQAALVNLSILSRVSRGIAAERLAIWTISAAGILSSG